MRFYALFSQTETYATNKIERTMYNIDAGLPYSFFKNKLGFYKQRHDI